MADTLPSVYMTRHMLEQVFITGKSLNVVDSFFVLQVTDDEVIGVMKTMRLRWFMHL